MPIDYTEKGFEENIESELVRSGYIERKLTGESLDEFKQHAIDTEVFFQFLEATQPKQLEKLKRAYKENYKQKIIHRLSKELSSRGMIDCLRHGVKDYGVKLTLAYNKPVSTMNRTLWEQYEQNLFTVSRQVYYSQKNNNSIDVLLSLNGLPIIVMELKNHLTGQTVDNAKMQFKKDRDPNELLFQFKKTCFSVFCS